MGRCERCGRPGPGGLCPQCVAQLSAQQSRPAGPPSDGEAFDPYRADPTDVGSPIEPDPDPYAAVSSIPPDPSGGADDDRKATRRRVGLAGIVAINVVVIALLAVGGWLLIMNGPWQKAGTDETRAEMVESEEPEASETPSDPPSETPSESATQPPVETPSEVPSETPRDAQTEVVDDAPSHTPAAPELVDGQPPALDRAIPWMVEYLTVAPGNPERAWQYLSPQRQMAENAASYNDHWNSVTRATLIEHTCRMDRTFLVCDHRYTFDSGKTQTVQNVKIPLTVEGGVIRIHVSPNASTGNGPAPNQSPPQIDTTVTEHDLEKLRSETLRDSRPVGPVVAVLSAKRNGITDTTQRAANGTHTFYYADILILHHHLVDQFRGERMYFLQSRDVDDKKSHDLYYTVVDRGFTSDAEVEYWCASAFPGLSGQNLKNVCLPRNLR